MTYGAPDSDTGLDLESDTVVPEPVSLSLLAAAGGIEFLRRRVDT